MSDGTPVPSVLLGASGWIGQHFSRLLADHPYFAPPVLTGAKSAGRTLEQVWQLSDLPVPAALADRRLERLSAAQIAQRGLRVAFSALPSDEAGPMETELARRGVSVFSNASSHRMDPRVPLVVPEVNGDHLKLLGAPRRRAAGGQTRRGFIVTNSNCSTAGLVLPVAPLLGLLRPRAVHVATYQALSGAGFPGVPSLAIGDNLLPFIRDEEEKMSTETGKILGRVAGGRVHPLELPVSAQCVRVATREGHLEAITLVLPSSLRVTPEEIVDAWESYRPLSADPGAGGGLPTAPERPVIYRPEEDRPQPLRDRWAGRPERARGMAVSVGRLRVAPGTMRFFSLSHNAVRGGAGGSVLNAELAYRQGYLG